MFAGLGYGIEIEDVAVGLGMLVIVWLMLEVRKLVRLLLQDAAAGGEADE